MAENNIYDFINKEILSMKKPLTSRILFWAIPKDREIGEGCMNENCTTDSEEFDKRIWQGAAAAAAVLDPSHRMNS